MQAAASGTEPHAWAEEDEEILGEVTVRGFSSKSRPQERAGVAFVSRHRLVFCEEGTGSVPVDVRFDNDLVSGYECEPGSQVVHLQSIHRTTVVTLSLASASETDSLKRYLWNAFRLPKPDSPDVDADGFEGPVPDRHGCRRGGEPIKWWLLHPRLRGVLPRDYSYIVMSDREMHVANDGGTAQVFGFRCTLRVSCDNGAAMSKWIQDLQEHASVKLVMAQSASLAQQVWSSGVEGRGGYRTCIALTIDGKGGALGYAMQVMMVWFFSDPIGTDRFPTLDDLEVDMFDLFREDEVVPNDGDDVEGLGAPDHEGGKAKNGAGVVKAAVVLEATEEEPPPQMLMDLDYSLLTGSDGSRYHDVQEEPQLTASTLAVKVEMADAMTGNSAQPRSAKPTALDDDEAAQGTADDPRTLAKGLVKRKTDPGSGGEKKGRRKSGTKNYIAIIKAPGKMKSGELYNVNQAGMNFGIIPVKQVDQPSSGKEQGGDTAKHQRRQESLRKHRGREGVRKRTVVEPRERRREKQDGDDGEREDRGYANGRPNQQSSSGRKEGRERGTDRRHGAERSTRHREDRHKNGKGGRQPKTGPPVERDKRGNHDHHAVNDRVRNDDELAEDIRNSRRRPRPHHRRAGEREMEEGRRRKGHRGGRADSDSDSSGSDYSYDSSSSYESEDAVRPPPPPKTYVDNVRRTQHQSNSSSRSCLIIVISIAIVSSVCIINYESYT